MKFVFENMPVISQKRPRVGKWGDFNPQNREKVIYQLCAKTQMTLGGSEMVLEEPIFVILRFDIPMPKTWSKKCLKMNLGKPHRKKKASWRKIGNKKKFYRSSWEANYARYLEFQKNQGWIKDWYHEPQTFWFEEIKRGVRSYLPDFKILKNDNSHYWVEVKGWMDQRSKTKLKRFKKYFPNEKLVLIEKKWFDKNNQKMNIIISDWE